MGVRLVLLRHGESEWNLANRFTGWTDVALSRGGIQEAHRAGHLLRAAGYVLLRHQRPTTCGLAVRVFHQLAPELLSAGELEKLLSILTSNPSQLVYRDTEYCLRKLAATVDRSSIHVTGRSRLECCLRGVLAGRLARVGIRMLSLQLLVHSPAGLQKTLNRAEQQRVIWDTQTDALAKLLGTLTGKSEEAGSLADLEFAQSVGRNGHYWLLLPGTH